MSEKPIPAKSSLERRSWGRRVLAIGMAGALAAGVVIIREGTDHGSEEIGVQAPSSQPVETAPQALENGTAEERERAHRAEINAVAQGLVERVVDINDEAPVWVPTEHDTARTEVDIPSHTTDGREAAFHFAAEVNLGPDGQPDLSQPRQVRASMKQGPESLYDFELVKLSDDVPFGEWGLYHHGLAGTAAGHSDGTDQTIGVTTLEEPTLGDGPDGVTLNNGNYLDRQWLMDASQRAIVVMDTAQAGGSVDPALVAL